ncbi:hypothetical protein PAEPH01_0468 [Pancytospora epiphaga]|nr:hypothetical protein PAEPH01_0468 [Pancytospora epiphaga]
MERGTDKKLEKYLNMLNGKEMQERGSYMNPYSATYMHDLHDICPNNEEFLMDDESRMMINPKQIYWIRKRRLRREMLDSIMVTPKTNYLHESRHKHAMKRLRAPSGRFLTKEETAKARMEMQFSRQSGSA